MANMESSERHGGRPYFAHLLALAFGAAALLAPIVLRAQNVDTNPPDERASGYILAPNDLVDIKVFQEDDLESKLRISKDGTITFPLVGVLRIGGKTPQDAARVVRDALAKGYLVNPQVTVNVISYTKYRVTVLGQVQKPGTYDFPDREKLSLLEAIGLAGGYTRGANPSKVIVKRLVDGKESVYQLNAKNMASQGATKGFEILPGDVITVSESMF
jgi:protein involved in polysaccharide export with SLBB domain